MIIDSTCSVVERKIKERTDDSRGLNSIPPNWAWQYTATSPTWTYGSFDGVKWNYSSISPENISVSNPVNTNTTWTFTWRGDVSLPITVDGTFFVHEYDV